jgi:aldehyde dehydrogenase
MRIFQEEIFGPVLAVTTFKTTEAIEIANDNVWFGCWSMTRMHMKFIRFQELFKGRVW